MVQSVTHLGGGQAAAPPEITDFVDTMITFYVIYSSATKITLEFLKIQ